MVDLVLAIETQEKLDVIPSGVRVVSLRAPNLRRCLPRLVRYLRSERPRAVVASMWPFTSLCVVATALARSNATLAVMDHNMLSIQYGSRSKASRIVLRSSLALTYRLADVRIAVSRGVADDVAGLAGISPGRVSVQYNPLSIGSNHDVGTDVAERAWQGWPGPRVLTVGRFKEQKNHRLLIDAFGRVLLSIPDAKLMIVGVGPLAASTAAYARTRGLADRVIFPGQFDDLVPFYRAADLFVLSSDFEGFGNVIVEALAFGLPVVSTDCQSGPSEILAAGRYGRLVPVGDAGALAEAVTDGLTREHDRSELMRRAADFSRQAAADALIQSLALTVPASI